MSDFVRDIPVHWNDCDPARIVFHAHYIRWMDEGFHALARTRGVDFAELQTADPAFRGSPLVDVRCTFKAPAFYGDTLRHVIAPPAFDGGRAFRVRHDFFREATLVATGEQVRIWGMHGGTGLHAAPVPAEIARRLRGEPA